MNILLFAPALAVILFRAGGISRLIVGGFQILSVQVSFPLCPRYALFYLIFFASFLLAASSRPTIQFNLLKFHFLPFRSFRSFKDFPLQMECQLENDFRRNFSLEELLYHTSSRSSECSTTFRVNKMDRSE